MGNQYSRGCCGGLSTQPAESEDTQIAADCKSIKSALSALERAAAEPGNVQPMSRSNSVASALWRSNSVASQLSGMTRSNSVASKMWRSNSVASQLSGMGALVSEVVGEEFPGAMDGDKIFAKVREALEPYGVKPENTIFGTSICSDEINNDPGHISTVMTDYFKKVFRLGGIGGAPFVGKTGFMAFSHHVPDSGHVVVLFGPHIGYSPDGEAGKFLRAGQAKVSTSCGAVVAAYSQCTSGGLAADETDIMQSWLRAKLGPRCACVADSDAPMVELVMQAYATIEEEMISIVNTGYGPGNLILIGGIQINMPYPSKGYFMPLHFSVRSATMAPENLMDVFELPSPRKKLQLSAMFSPRSPRARKKIASSIGKPQQLAVAKAVQQDFPGAMDGAKTWATVEACLKPYGVKPENTIFGTSICSDEINNDPGHTSRVMKDYFKKAFRLGGIGGAPFVGKTGFMAFSHHVPDSGHVVVLFGPHIGYSPDGEAGKFLRAGQAKVSTSCGAVIAAYGQCTSGGLDADPADLEQSWLRSKIGPRCACVADSKIPMVELVMQAYAAVEEELLSIVNTNYGPGNLILIGGIQINMPYPMKGHFMPLHFSVRSATMRPKSLMNAFGGAAGNEASLDTERAVPSAAMGA